MCSMQSCFLEGPSGMIVDYLWDLLELLKIKSYFLILDFDGKLKLIKIILKQMNLMKASYEFFI